MIITVPPDAGPDLGAKVKIFGGADTSLNVNKSVEIASLLDVATRTGTAPEGEDGAIASI